MTIADQLKDSGFAIIPSVLSYGAVDELIARITSAFDRRDASSNHAMRNLVQEVPAVRKVAEGPAIRNLVEPVLGSDAFVARSLLFDKTAEANWKVAWHQDVTIAVREKIEVPGFGPWSVKDNVMHTQPPVAVVERILTVRLHLDDCDLGSGPLHVIPGSHKSGRLSAAAISEWREQRTSVPCTVLRGGALLMRPLLLHASSPALEPRHRRVVHLEFAADPLPGGLRWL